MSTRESYTLLSFKLTDKFSAWYRQDDASLTEYPLEAIGLAKLETLTINHLHEVVRRKDLGNVIVGIELDEEGMTICNEVSNFVCIMRKGRKPGEAE